MVSADPRYVLGIGLVSSISLWVFAMKYVVSGRADKLLTSHQYVKPEQRVMKSAETTGDSELRVRSSPLWIEADAPKDDVAMEYRQSPTGRIVNEEDVWRNFNKGATASRMPQFSTRGT
jgi:hypothetical protein